MYGYGYGIFVVHGGLFRNNRGDVGTIPELQAISRTTKDPDTEMLLDVLWSDPQKDLGLNDNHMRGCATFFGPDCTRDFLERHGLHLVLRSHEGPDARAKRPSMTNDMMAGYSIDQEDEYSGQPLLITLFSAPDYPQGASAKGNTAAYIVFDGSKDDLAYEVKHFGRSPRRPEVKPYPAAVNDLTDLDRSRMHHDDED
jgi:serine/threonine-protein phosphatase 5